MGEKEGGGGMDCRETEDGGGTINRGIGSVAEGGGGVRVHFQVRS